MALVLTHHFAAPLIRICAKSISRDKTICREWVESNEQGQCALAKGINYRALQGRLMSILDSQFADKFVVCSTACSILTTKKTATFRITGDLGERWTPKSVLFKQPPMISVYTGTVMWKAFPYHHAHNRLNWMRFTSIYVLHLCEQWVGERFRSFCFSQRTNVLHETYVIG